jgi:hypothetical protein
MSLKKKGIWNFCQVVEQRELHSETIFWTLQITLTKSIITRIQKLQCIQIFKLLGLGEYVIWLRIWNDIIFGLKDLERNFYFKTNDHLELFQYNSRERINWPYFAVKNNQVQSNGKWSLSSYDWKNNRSYLKSTWTLDFKINIYLCVLPITNKCSWYKRQS